MAISSNVRPPELDDPTQFVRIDRIPVIDTCKRTYYTKSHDESEFKKVEESIDVKQLIRFRNNSRERQEKGEYGIIFIGHTNDHDKEEDQPPIVGYMKNYEFGEHKGNPALLADLYIDVADDPSKILKQFPRRSAEIIDIHSPDGYIDSVALLKRSPERPLGLVTHYNSNLNISRFECPSCEEERKAMIGDGITKADLKSMLSEMFSPVKIKSMITETLTEMVGGDPQEVIARSEASRFAKKGKTKRFESTMNDDPDTSPSDEEPSEPKKKVSKMAKEEDDPFEPSEPSEPEKPTKKTSKMEKPAKKTSKMEKRMDPSEDEPSEDEPSEDEPSKMESKKKKSRYSHSKQDFVNLQKEVARMRRELQQDPSADRMKREQGSTQVSRYESRIKHLEDALTASNKKARTRELEAIVIQLESEGIELDRARTVSKFSRMNEDEIKESIEDIRKFNKRSPVGQPMLGGFVESGGSTVERPRSYFDALQPAPEDINPDGTHIVGSGVARFARMNNIEIKRGTHAEASADVVARYNAARKKDKSHN